MLTLDQALESIQDFGFSPDSAEIIIVNNELHLKGAWFEDRILPYIEKEAKALNINIGVDECKILAIY